MFHSLRVARVVEETPEARSFVLEVPASLATEMRYRSGQFITVQVELGGELLRRCYSLASCPDVEPAHKFTVKRTAGGRVSNWMNDHVAEGDRLFIQPPEGRFVLDAREAPLLLFAAGSGITPVISILKSALATGRRRITLLYANRNRASTIFASELDRLREAHADRLSVVHRHDDVHGMIDEGSVREVATHHRDASVFLCGPAPFMTLVESSLERAGVELEHVHVERFTHGSASSTVAGEATTDAAPPQEGTPEFLEVLLRGERHRVPYVRGKTLLQCARDAGLDAPYSCEEGFCGCCASDLLEGRVKMDADDALSPAEKKKGMILACQSRPLTSRCVFRFVDG
jgi:3-ketosteroid 9alpha-monooxygenase subunit B